MCNGFKCLYQFCGGLVLCRAKAVGGLPQQLSLATVALRKCGVSSLKSLGRPIRSPVIRGATAEDVEAEKEMIEMDAVRI